MLKHVLTIFLALCVLIAPIVAVTNVIPQGGEVFLGEEGLNIREALPSPYFHIAYYPPGASPGRDQPLDIRSVAPDQFSVIPSLYLDRTGAWYQWDQARGAPGNVAFIVREPRISLKVMDRSTLADRSFGTVPRGTQLVIQVETNLAGVTRRPGFTGKDTPIELRIVTPGGGSLSGVTLPSGDEYPFSAFIPTSDLSYAPPVDIGGWDTGGRGYQAGVYRIEPYFSFNRVRENLRTLHEGYLLRGAEITLGSDRVGLHLSSDQVIRGDPFSVTITGTPGSPYLIWVDGGGRTGNQGDQPPMIITAQEGVRQDPPYGPYSIGAYQPSGSRYSIRDLVASEPYGGVRYYAELTPDRNGKRTVEFFTSSNTNDGRYTIRLEGPRGASAPKTEREQVEIIMGTVSVSTDRNTFALGEEIFLTGKNTASCDTYLFMTGPNLPAVGGRLDNPRRAVENGNPGSFTVTTGDCETWEYRFNTRGLGIDFGTYTIYAVSTPSDRYHLEGTSWQTIPVSFRRPTVSVTEPAQTVAKGDEIVISGLIGGDPDTGVAVWIFGRNYFRYDTARGERSGAFTYELSGSVTGAMEPGEYVILVQHPMGDGEFNIRPDRDRQMVLGTQPYPGAPQFRVGGPGALQGPAAAAALIEALDSPFIDDVYAEYSIRVVNPTITFDPASLRNVAGKPIIISGTTNMAEGSRILLEITDDWFGPVPKTERSLTAGFSGVVTVETDESGRNTFSLEIPAGRLPVGSYRVIAQAVTAQVTATGTLTVTHEPLEELPAHDTATPVQSPEERVTPGPALTQEETPVQEVPVTTPEPMITEEQPAPAVPEGTPGMGIPVFILVIALVAGIAIFGRNRISPNEPVETIQEQTDASVGTKELIKEK